MSILDELKEVVGGFFKALKKYIDLVIEVLKNPFVIVNPEFMNLQVTRAAIVLLLKSSPAYKDKSEKELYEIADNLLKGAAPAGAASLVEMCFVPEKSGAELAGHSLYDAVIKDLDDAWKDELSDDELQLVEELKKQGYKDAESYVRAYKALTRYLGKNFSVNFYSWLTGVIAEIAGVGQIETVAQLMNAWNWGLGFGWLTWIALSSTFQYIIARPIEDYYLWKFRPKDLTAAQYITLFLRGYISKEELKEALARQGYPDEAIDRLIKYRERLLTLSELQNALKYNLIDEEKFREELRKLGYPKEYIDLLVRLTRVSKIEKERDLTKSEILRLYSLKIIDRDEAKSLLMKLGYSEHEAELLLDIEDYKETSKIKHLTYSQIRRLYFRGIIDKVEATNMLKELHYSDEAIKRILELWEYEKQRTTIKIPLSIIKLAYLYGVLDKDKVEEILKKMGYADNVIQIYLGVWDREKERRTRTLTASQIVNFYKYKVISKDEALQLLEQKGYSRESAELMLEYANLKPSPRRIRLTRTDIINALKKKVIDEDTARYLLNLLGYSDEEIDILINTYI